MTAATQREARDLLKLALALVQAKGRSVSADTLRHQIADKLTIQHVAARGRLPNTLTITKTGMLSSCPQSGPTKPSR